MPATLCESLLARLGAVAFELAPDGTTCFVSQGLSALTGYDPADALGRNWWELLCQGRQSDQVAVLLDRLRAGDVNAYPLSITTQAGASLTCQVDTANRYSSTGELLAIAGYATLGLTRPNRAEEALRESERRYRTLFETMQEGFALCQILAGADGQRADYRFLEVNPAFESLTGLRASQVLGRTTSEIVPESERWLVDSFDGAAVACRPEHLEHYSAAARRTYHITVYCPQPDQIVLFLSDVSDRRATEAQCLFQAHLLDVVEQAVIATDLTGAIIYWNRFAEILYGWTAAEALGRTTLDLAALPGAPGQWPATQSQLQTPPSQSVEFDARGRDGNLFPVQVTYSPIYDDQGSLIGHVGVSLNITDRRRAQAAREQHMTRLAGLLQLSQRILAARSFTDLYQSIADGARELVGGQLSAAGHGYSAGRFQRGATSRAASLPATVTSEELMVGLQTPFQTLTARPRSFRLSADDMQGVMTIQDLPAGHGALRNLVGAPLLGQGGQLRGMVIVADKLQGDFTSEDEGLLTQLANLASLALQHVEAREEAEQRAAEFSTVFNALTDAVMVYTDQFHLVQANPAACAAFGCDPAAPPLKPLAGVTLLYPDQRPVPEDMWPWQRALRGETVRNEQFIFRRPYGPDIHILASAAPLETADRRQRVIATWHDVTERDQLVAELENERSRWLATVESMLDFVVVTDAEGKYVYLNSAYARSLRPPQLGDARPIDQDQPAYPGLVRLEGAVRPLGALPLMEAWRRNAPVENREMLEITREGEERTLLWNASPIRGAGGDVAGAVAVGHDISQQKATELALRAARNELEQRVLERTRALYQTNEELRAEITERLAIEQQLQLQTSALEAAANGIVITDRQGLVLWVNPAFTRLTGFDPQECLGRTLRLQRSGEHSPAFYQNLWQTILAGQVWRGEIINCHKSGRTYIEEQIITPVVDPAGHISHFISIKQDISERKRTEQALLRANALLERVFDSMDLLIAYLDRDYNFVRVNRAYAEWEGHPPESLAGQNHFTLHPDPEIKAVFERVVETGEAYSAFEQPFIYGDRLDEEETTFWDWSLQPVKDADGQVLGLVFSLVNVTFRKYAQDQLRRNARQSQMLAEVSKALAEAKLDSQSVVDTVAQQLGELFGDLCFIRLLADDGQRLKLVAHYHPDPESQARLVQQVDSPVVNLGEGLAGQVAATGQPVYIPMVSSEQDLKTFNEAFRPLLAPLHPSLLAVPIRAQGRTLGVLTLLRLHHSQPYTPDDVSIVQNIADRAALAIANAHLYQDLEAALAQEQAIRTQLVQVEKLAGMGRMVASVAHELNNPLQTIKNCLYLTHKDLPPDSPVQQYTEMASSETQRLARLVAQLREVYRPRSSGPMQPLDLLPLLAELPVLLKSQLAEHRVQFHLATSLTEAPVSGIADQLRQVFLNLGQNAAEAMHAHGGQLTVGVGLSDDERQLGVIFSDTGPGIPAENLNRLFEPFFTTKFTGLGLGLSICNDIVQRHGGRLTVESEPGQGATFAVWLPRQTPAKD